ncbi:serine/threonine-protein kinase Nek6-like [Ipomoea triloba]|uniref:serine/threonine-protein kinase Nek6-like n=1 Tax=Ipomoea triloba TaxID=35885 RepID=UPI00125E7E92|nr:serine/threonine-protein kinase Nek6-like [Ipomoea triloba]XP_031128327.1 serine/threonine-protein kinase Nek6-like [Ipomoea triloba]
MEGRNSGVDAMSKMEDYEVIEQIGTGALGTAFLVLHKTENKKYVLKKIPLAKQTEKLKRTVHQEMNLITKLNHPYVVEYKDAWLDKGSCICLITRYCEGRDMAEFLRKSRGALFPEEKLCKWLTQLLLAVDYLHSNRVLHRDLKLSNIFITNDDDVCLGDFGLAKLLDPEGLTSLVVGTPNYMCPELLADMPYGYKSDIWSLGCCMFEIAGHQLPFRAPNMTGLINKINRCTLSPLPIIYSSTLKQIIKSMLRKSPEHRPTAAELLRHQHLQQFLLQCRNPSSVFLPVRSPRSTKEKTGKPSPSKSSSGKDNRGQLIGRGPVFSLDRNVGTQPRNLPNTSKQIEAKLETKRVDRTSYSAKISEDSEESLVGDASETAGNEEEHSELFLQKESLKVPTPSDFITPKSNPEEQEETSLHVQHFEEGDEESDKTKDLEVLNCTNGNGEVEMEAVDCIAEKTSRMTLSNAKSFDQESASSTTQPLNSEPEGNAEPRSLYQTENVDLCREVALDCASVKKNGTATGEEQAGIERDAFKNSENEEDSIQITDEQAQSRISLLRKLTALTSESKDEWGNPTQQRADALESLLELCAQLLKQDKIDELYGVLKPFGEDAVSSRETAIWLTKTLMKAQK